MGKLCYVKLSQVRSVTVTAAPLLEIVDHERLAVSVGGNVVAPTLRLPSRT